MDKKTSNKQSGRGTLEQRILEMLEKSAENMLTVSELKKRLKVKKDAYQSGVFYPSHFYKTIKNLESRGKLRIIPKRVPESLKSEIVVFLVKGAPAGLDEIKPILENLKDPHEFVHKNAAIDLYHLSLRKRIYITPEISKVLSEILSNESYQSTRNYLLETLFSILMTAKGEDDSQIIKRIEEKFPDILSKIASNNSDNIVDRILAIKLLGKLEVSKVLDSLFSIIVNEDEKISYNKLQAPLISALCFLYPIFGAEIRTRLYQLLKSKNTQERAEYVLSVVRARSGAIMSGASEKR